MAADVWPELTAENRPWTRWWWMGNALSEAEITRHLELFHQAGIGGVEVSPIYGPTGSEARWVPFLSPRWVELFGHTLREARRLGMGVDLICGTGWPFGGPWVTPEDSARRAWVEDLGAGETESKKQPGAALLATAEAGGHRYALFLAPTGQQVKRAAPGGAGNVLDHFRKESVRRYLAPFDKAFDALPDDLKPRCCFNDSWEVFAANATPDILQEFEQRRGYDLRSYLGHFKGDGDPEMVRRVRSDYRETIQDLTRESFLETWAGWARQRGARARNQAHGSPGNLLDLYAQADIPETEVFGPVRLRLGGLEAPSPYLPPDFGGEEELLVCKMASSAAHVAGRPLCSSESFTWLGEHGHVPLEHMKTEVDLLFCCGINHIFFHGTPFSPADAPWPGWLFYASTLCAPTNPFWRDLPALNGYIGRCQSLLQSGVPDSDVLVYFPFYDLIAGESGAQDQLQFLAVHRTAAWLRGNLPEFTAAAHLLWKRGWAYDLVSDQQLTEDVRVEEGLLNTTGGLRCRVLLVAGCRITPPATVERWLELAKAGATVLIVGDLPEDVPGLSNLEERRARLRAVREQLGKAAEQDGKIRRYSLGAGRVLVGPDAGALLEAAKVPRETVADAGIEFCRRRVKQGDREAVAYFLSNPGREQKTGWFTLTQPAASALLLDPLTGETGRAALTQADGKARVFIDLPAGASLLLRTGAEAGSDWPYHAPDAGAVSLDGAWEVRFIEGGPTLPPARRLSQLADWTQWEKSGPAATELQAFSGTARYTHTFDAPALPAGAAGWVLELGKVGHSAHVRLNGQEVGTVLARPWRITLPKNLLRPKGNVLEVDVTNLMANRIADLERREGDKWRPFLMVNIRYKPWDAAEWKPVPSGLLGPVRLTPLRSQQPGEE